MILLLPGCFLPVEEPFADSDVFFAEVEPVLITRCANPSCHGSVERPFELYGTHRHRLDEADTWLDTDLNSEEHQRNYARTLPFLISPLVESPLLCKPLPAEAGGCLHGGGVVFLDTAEPEWQAILDWPEE